MIFEVKISLLITEMALMSTKFDIIITVKKLHIVDQLKRLLKTTAQGRSIVCVKLEWMKKNIMQFLILGGS